MSRTRQSDIAGVTAPHTDPTLDRLVKMADEGPPPGMEMVLYSSPEAIDGVLAVLYLSRTADHFVVVISRALEPGTLTIVPEPIQDRLPPIPVHIRLGRTAGQDDELLSTANG